MATNRISNGKAGAAAGFLYFGMPITKAIKARTRELQKRLNLAGFNPGAIDGVFGFGTQSAVLAFQRSAGLLADGVVGPRTAAALSGRKPASLPDVLKMLTPATVSRMFPNTSLAPIKRNLPAILAALKAHGLGDRLMAVMALATIRAETESFEPIAEGISRYNTSPDPNGHPFDLYDSRKDLGNRGQPDGERFRGRGYVQLTGRYNYATYGKKLDLGDGLLKNPEQASDPKVAAQLLAVFLKDKERAIKEALLDWDFRAARRLVNGGTHGLDRFTDAYKTGMRLTA
ncbi:MAG: peptidoglycan-binding protein [Burkholderiales bacterium]|nr:peptidoglycan-binding protein [Burkholderiales bacterium]